ncbi:MAG: sigma-70 family RNA polymerase sigma factor [Bacteroidetes bacterium]|nr:sigma-70 family RNA polymerase sigma factor [Bacteroidota bacterium]
MTDGYYIQGHSSPAALAPDAQKRLVKDCIAGKRAAQHEFYNHYAPFVYGVIRRYLFNANAAEEVLNDTFFRVFTKMDQYGFKGSLEGWMRRIAINLVTDHLRGHIKFENEVYTDSDAISAYVDENQVSKLSYKELLAYVHELPDTHRLVFNLYVFEDLPHKEIAQLIGITENNSRWHLNDARRRLKEKINNVK